MATMQKSLAESPKDDPRMLAYGAYTHASMAAEFVVDTERWDAAERLLPGTPGKAKDSKATADADPYQAFAAVAQTPAIFARGLAAAMKGSPDAQHSAAALRAIREQRPGTREPAIEQVLKMSQIHELEIAAVASVSKGNVDEAIKIMQKAAAVEEAMGPPPGPPIKPSYELYGEILLRTGHPAEAAQQFAKSLFRYPNRARSLLGAARAAGSEWRYGTRDQHLWSILTSVAASRCAVAGAKRSTQLPEAGGHALSEQDIRAPEGKDEDGNRL